MATVELERYVVTAPHGTTTEHVVVRARSHEESFEEALRVLAKMGIQYVEIKRMTSERKP